MINRGRHRRSAYTLIEMTVSLAVMSVLMGGVGSAMVLASRAMPASESPHAARLASYHVMDLLANELIVARTVTESTATSITFTVADRDLDGVPETIRYAWSGTAGDPLTRQYNGGSPANVATNVYGFNLKYTMGTSSSTSTMRETVTTKSPEMLFASFEGWSGLTAELREKPLSPTEWVAQFFVIDQVAIPVGANRVEITRVLIKLKDTIGGQGVTVGIHQPISPNNIQPMPPSVGTPATLSGLPDTYLWTQATFTDVLVTGRGNEFLIMVKGTASTGLYAEYLHNTNAPTDGPILLWTNNSGGKWHPGGSQRAHNDAAFFVYGTYETSEEKTVSVSTNQLACVYIGLRIGPYDTEGVLTSIPTLNLPELPTP